MAPVQGQVNQSIIYIKKIMAENKIDTMKKSIRDLNDLVNDVSESV